MSRRKNTGKRRFNLLHGPIRLTVFQPSIMAESCTSTTCVVLFTLVFTHTPMCVSTALYNQYFPEFCVKISKANYSGGIQRHDPCMCRACVEYV